MKANILWVPACRRVVGLLLLVIAGTATSSPPHRSQTQEMPGLTTSNELYSHVVPLTAADVEFYLSILAAAADRAQHPTPVDLSDIAEAKRQYTLMHLAIEGKATFNPTAAETSSAIRGNALMSTEILEWLASQAGMPKRQWRPLQQTVEDAAGLNDGAIYGASDDTPAPAPSLEQRAYVQKAAAVRAANRALVAPNASRVRTLRETLLASLSKQISSE